MKALFGCKICRQHVKEDVGASLLSAGRAGGFEGKGSGETGSQQIQPSLIGGAGEPSKVGGAAPERALGPGRCQALRSALRSLCPGACLEATWIGPRPPRSSCIAASCLSCRHRSPQLSLQLLQPPLLASLGALALPSRPEDPQQLSGDLQCGQPGPIR